MKTPEAKTMRGFIVFLSLTIASPLVAASLRPASMAEHNQCYYFIYRDTDRNFNKAASVFVYSSNSEAPARLRWAAALPW